MKLFGTTGAVRAALATLVVALVSSCAAPPPPPAPVAPPPVVRIPPRPVPPMGASPDFRVPPRQFDGSRLTVNSNLSTAQAVWNLRSAYNVAALNCLRPEHAGILPGYSGFLKTHARSLKTANSDLDKNFQAKHGRGYIRVRESYQTQVYNFFALPPVVPALCDETLAMVPELAALAPGQLEGAAPAALARLDGVYQQFFRSFDQYLVDVAAWDQRYGAGQAVAAGASSSQSLAQ